ncbi:MAG: tetratricopeptide repeat protein [Kiloniellales bacterium]
MHPPRALASARAYDAPESARRRGRNRPGAEGAIEKNSETDKDAKQMNETAAKLESAVAAHREGRVAEAEAVYRQILADDPANAEARHMLGVAHLQSGRPEEAVEALREAIAGDSSDARYYNNLGNALLALGRPDEAVGAFATALDRDPEFDLARFNRGTAHYALRRLGLAEVDFRATFARQPDNADALNNLGAVLLKQNRITEAADCFRRGREHHPEDATFAVNLASALEMSNDLEGAEAAARAAVEAIPEAAAPRLVLARVERRNGRLQEARGHLDAALSMTLSNEDRIEALFELGLVLDHGDDAEAAFAAFAEANRLRRESPDARRLDGGRFLDRVAACQSFFTVERLRDFAGRAARDPAPAPVFFVGFPRSGTTLMEQAMKAHPGLATTGEASPLAPLLAELRRRGGYPEMLDKRSGSDLDAMRRGFWKGAEQIVGPLEGRRLVDKLPLNIVDLGFANLLFPEARVVVALRDPRDVCLSCLMQRFSLNEAMVNFLDLERTAETYAAVMGLWRHYREALTLTWMEYRYEDLVEDFEGVVRTVLDFIGVGWDEAVAGYPEAAAGEIVTTPSDRDVVDPQHRHAVGRWRRYAEALGPVRDELAPSVAAFGYPEA